MHSLRLLVPAVVLALTSTLHAQTLQNPRPPRAPSDMVVADLLGEPDNLLLIPSFKPGFRAPGSVILATPVNYLRGLAFDTRSSGYFVSGFSEGGGPTGFFRFENGQTSLVAPFPLVSWGSLGDVSWSRGRDFLWYTWDPAGAQKETLYKIDLDGTFTQMGELHYANNVKVDICGGIAVDPRSGVLYSYDQTRARLVTVDPATSLTTLVGSSNLATYPNVVIMCMEFAPDGRLYLMQNFGNLFEVNPATGAATPAGAVDTLCSAMAFVPPEVPMRQR